MGTGSVGEYTDRFTSHDVIELIFGQRFLYNIKQYKLLDSF